MSKRLLLISLFLFYGLLKLNAQAVLDDGCNWPKNISGTDSMVHHFKAYLGHNLDSLLNDVSIKDNDSILVSFQTGGDNCTVQTRLLKIFLKGGKEFVYVRVMETEPIVDPTRPNQPLFVKRRYYKQKVVSIAYYGGRKFCFVVHR